MSEQRTGKHQGRRSGRAVGPAERISRLFDEAAAAWDGGGDQAPGSSHTATPAEARHAVYWIAHRRLQTPVARIGRICAVSDGAVRYGLARIDDRADDRSLQNRLAAITARAVLGPVQHRALLLLADGKALISNTTDPARRTIARATALSLEQLGLAHAIEIVAVLSDAGHHAVTTVGEVPAPVHDHGSSACYVLDGCRCLPCRVAHTGEMRNRAQQQAYGRHRGQVDAEEARTHVRQLMASGVGAKQVAKVAGVSKSALDKLLGGTADRPPSRRIRAATHDRLLAVTSDDLADGTTVSADGIHPLVDELLAAKFARAEIARLISDNPATRSLQLDMHGRVTVANARRVAQLHRVWRAGLVSPTGKLHRNRTVPKCTTVGCDSDRRAGDWCAGCIANGVVRDLLSDLDDHPPSLPPPSLRGAAGGAVRRTCRETLQVGPLQAAVEARGGIGVATAHLEGTERLRLRRAYWRALESGRLSELMADEFAVRVLGSHPTLVWGQTHDQAG